MGITEDTVSIATQASWIFGVDDDSFNRRRTRSPEPGRAVGYQFERVYDMIASEAIVLCDSRGNKLRSTGDQQLCRLLSQAVPPIFSGQATKDIQLKALDIVRPNIAWNNIAIRPIPIPQRKKQLFVASISESTFNEAGVLHAGSGVKRILGIPSHVRSHFQHVISSKDRLAFDVSKAIGIGFHDFYASPVANDLRIPRRRGPRRSSYVQALGMMLDRVDVRLEREGLCVDRPTRWSRWFTRGQMTMEGYRSLQFALPVRRRVTRRQLGSLQIEMTVYDRQFSIPEPPKAVLVLES